ncbi:MAG: hypothetical protein DYH15_02410 [Nitrosomonas sp. PRO4]|nr:hypothetical protein [Nitrosomonas sp. PRO4]
MKWFLGILILILIVVSARFRKFAITLALVGISIGLMAWQYQEYDKGRVKDRIHPSELALENISFKQIEDSFDYEMTGRIFNHSEKYVLNGLLLNLSAKECKDFTESGCVIVSEQKENVYITVPPGQARDFRKNIYLYSNQKTNNHLIWNYSIQYAISE